MTEIQKSLRGVGPMPLRAGGQTMSRLGRFWSPVESLPLGREQFGLELTAERLGVER